MRKNINTATIAGYVYQSKLTARETGPNSKNPGTPFIMGDLEIATDEEGFNIIPVHFTYVTETYGKSGKANPNFKILSDIINGAPTWLVDGKDSAMKVSISCSIGVNDFIAQDGSPVAAKRCEGSFVNRLDRLPEVEKRNTFQEDMLITKVVRVEADPDKPESSEYVRVGGAIFDFRNALLPVEFIVRNEQGMDYFENLNASSSEPAYTKVWGHIKNESIKIERIEESAFGEPIVYSTERTNREWLVTGTSGVLYDFGDEGTMTAEELKSVIADREIHLADVKKRNDEYLASKNAPAASNNTFQF